MKDNINILFISDGLSTGGKERQLAEIIKSINKKENYRTGIITFNREQHFSEYIKSNVHYFKELKKRPTRLEPFFSIWIHIRRFKPDIIHTWDSLSSMYTYLPARIFTIKFIDGSVRDAGIEKGWQFFLKRFFLKRADLIISNSEAGLTHYGFSGEVLYNAIDIKRFPIQTRGKEINLIMVANFTVYKDHSTFIRAGLALLKDGIVDNVYLAGDGPHKQNYVDLINSTYSIYSDRIFFLGSISNVEENLAKCTFGVLCSTLEYAEGISNSVLEYMAAGLIAISTDVGGMKEVIEDGVNGFLIPPGDSDMIVKIITKLRLDRNTCNTITENARRTISEKFSCEGNINKLMSIYSGLCTKK